MAESTRTDFTNKPNYRKPADRSLRTTSSTTALYNHDVTRASFNTVFSEFSQTDDDLYNSEHSHYAFPGHTPVAQSDPIRVYPAVLTGQVSSYEPLNTSTREVLPVPLLVRSYEVLNPDPFNEIFPCRPLRQTLENNCEFEESINLEAVPLLLPHDDDDTHTVRHESLDVIDLGESSSTDNDDNHSDEVGSGISHYNERRLLPDIPGHQYESLERLRRKSKIDTRCSLRTQLEIAGSLMLCFLLIAVVVLGVLLNNNKIENNVIEPTKNNDLKIPSNTTRGYDNKDIELGNGVTTAPSLNYIMPNNEPVAELNATLFLVNPTLISVINMNGSVRGITVLNGEIFVVQAESSLVFVYDTINFALIRNISISDSRRPNLSDIVASPHHNCLYISDMGLKVIRQYNLSNNAIRTWSVDGVCYGLSLTRANTLLATLIDARLIQEYGADGSFITELNIDSLVNRIDPWHSIKMHRDRFVVSHGESGLMARVSVLDRTGRAIWFIDRTGNKATRVVRFSRPIHMAIDSYDNVLVADEYNNRVMLLSPSMNHFGEIEIPGHQLSLPRALHLDTLNRRLYIGEENATGRIFVLTV